MDRHAVTVMSGHGDLVALRAAVPHVYEREAAAWDALRPRAFFEQPWIDRAVADLPAGARVLDLGAGAGDPIATYLAGLGLRVTGIDIAPSMVRLARDRVPEADWMVADMRHIDLRARFGAIIGWDSFFHLTPTEQRATLPRLMRHLSPGGRLLLTVGPRPGEVVGQVNGSPLYHASLGAGEYLSLARGAGAAQVTLQAEDVECRGRSLLLVQARRA